MTAQTLRDGEVAKLTEIVTTPDERVNIVAVSGAGGVGKTFLVDHVLDAIDLEHSGYLKLAADGMSSQLRADFVGLIDQKLALRTLHRPAKPGKDYFPSIREVADAHAALLTEVEAEVIEKCQSAPQRTVIEALVRGGVILNKLVPKSEEFLNFSALPLEPEKVQEVLQESIEMARKLQALAVKEPTYLPRFLRNMVGMTLRNRVRRDLHGVTADHLSEDLSKCVGPRKTRKRLGIRISGHEFSRLLVVLDDFEVLGPVLSDFVFGSFVPRLENADFETVLIVVGRDDLQASNPDWAYRYQRYFRGQIRLAPFSRDQALEFLRAHQITGQDAEEIFKYTEGFPFLLKLICEERGVTGDKDAFEQGAADVPRQFFDRTTRWMSSREIDWFTKIVYLDKVNADTLGWFFSADAVETILRWFEREGAVRDPRARVFRVRGVIREKVLQYLSTRQPTKHQQMLDIIKARMHEDGAGTPLSAPVQHFEGTPAKSGALKGRKGRP
jgi:hypothetical protein